MKYVLIAAMLGTAFFGRGQNFEIQIQPVLFGGKVVLERPLRDKNGDSLTISTLRFYLGNFDFWKNGQVIFSDKTHRLLDLEDEKSMALDFHLPQNTAFDSIQFDIGVDSATNVSGAMGSDLDPTRGMFWTWQSGYINFKMEGFSSKCPAQKGYFEFHLGGFAAPTQTVRQVKIKNMGSVLNPSIVWLEFDLAPFFQKIDWAKKPSIMSPCAEAAQLMDILSRSLILKN